MDNEEVGWALGYELNISPVCFIPLDVRLMAFNNVAGGLPEPITALQLSLVELRFGPLYPEELEPCNAGATDGDSIHTTFWKKLRFSHKSKGLKLSTLRGTCTMTSKLIQCHMGFCYSA